MSKKYEATFSSSSSHVFVLKWTHKVNTVSKSPSFPKDNQYVRVLINSRVLINALQQRQSGKFSTTEFCQFCVKRQCITCGCPMFSMSKHIPYRNLISLLFKPGVCKSTRNCSSDCSLISCIEGSVSVEQRLEKLPAQVTSSLQVKPTQQFIMFIHQLKAHSLIHRACLLLPSQVLTIRSLLIVFQTVTRIWHRQWSIYPQVNVNFKSVPLVTTPESGDSELCP